MKKNKVLFIYLILNCYFTYSVDLIIFSMNRPLQLYACLESIERNCINYNNIYTIYKATTYEFLASYQVIKNYFKEVVFLEQNNTLNGQDFKPFIMDILNNNSVEYAAFLVDDIIVKDYVDLKKCTMALKENSNFIGFFLRLGTNIQECYSLKIKFHPPCKLYKDDIYMWKFKNGLLDKPGWDALSKGDWNFATTLDFTIYKKEFIKEGISGLDFYNPTFEGSWWDKFKQIKANLKKNGLCFEKSKIVNICTNVVNVNTANWSQFSKDWLENHYNNFSVEALLNVFNRGFKIDINEFFKINNKSPHIECEFRFIER